MTRPRPVRRLGALVFAAACAVGLAACGSSGSGTGSSGPVKSGGTLTYALDEDVAGFNINQANDNQFVLQEIMDNVWPTVFVPTPNLKLQLNTDLVTSAKVTSSSPQTVVYQINPKAAWSDGTPITADDFVYMWQANSGDAKYTDVGGKAYLPASTAGYNQVKSVTGSGGGKTVTVVFSKPFGDWQSLFEDLMPAHIAKKAGFNDGFQNFGASVKVSGGPFQITGYAKGQDLVETPNPKYWGAKPSLSKLVFRIILDDNQVPPAMQNGEVNMANPALASIAFKAAVTAVPNVTTNVTPGLEFQHLDFNEANPYLKLAAVRHAIAYGTNREEMVQRIVTPISPTIKPLDNRMFMPTQPQYKDTSGGYGAFNVAEAKKELTSAGMTLGSDGYFHPDFGPEKGKDLSFSISTTSGVPVRAQIEQLFQADMKSIGVKINIQNYSAATLFGTVGPKSEYDLIEFAWVNTPFASGAQTEYCSYTNASVCGENWNHYANPKVDALLSQALTTIDPTAAAALYNQADTLMWQDMVTLPLFEQPDLYSWSSAYGNIQPNSTNWGIPWNAAKWGLKS